jgi:hypothetical protein
VNDGADRWAWAVSGREKEGAAVVARFRLGMPRKEVRGGEGKEGERAGGEMGQQAENEEGRGKRRIPFLFIFYSFQNISN